MVVDCGGGTVDVTVHEISMDGLHLREVFKATGGPFGATSKHVHCTLREGEGGLQEYGRSLRSH